MQVISNAGIGIILVGLAAATPVVAETGQELERCKAQVARYYGDNGEVKLISRRQYIDGTRMKVALRSEDATTGYSHSRLATCWVEAENSQAGWLENEAPMVAASDGATENKTTPDF